MGSILSKITEGPALDAKAEQLVQKSPFAVAEPPPLTMQAIADALESKRAEQKASLKRLAELLQQACDILNSLDA